MTFLALVALATLVTLVVLVALVPSVIALLIALVILRFGAGPDIVNRIPKSLAELMVLGEMKVLEPIFMGECRGRFIYLVN